MAFHTLALALSVVASTSQAPPYPAAAAAPPGTPQTRYCLRVDPLIGSRIETVQCMTREEWAMLGLDVDREWAENGVRIIA